MKLRQDVEVWNIPGCESAKQETLLNALFGS
jgi:hypothetical protein